MSGRILVKIELDPFPTLTGECFAVQEKLGDIVVQSWRPVDVISDDLPAEFFGGVTGAQYVTIQAARKLHADRFAKEISRLICEALEAKDLKNGYAEQPA